MKRTICSLVCGLLVLMLCISCTKKAEEETVPAEGAAVTDSGAAPRGEVVELSYSIFFRPPNARATPVWQGRGRS